jgi:hypothetical protein
MKCLNRVCKLLNIEAIRCITTGTTTYISSSTVTFLDPVTCSIHHESGTRVSDDCMENRYISRPYPHRTRLAIILVPNWIGLVDFLGPQLVREFCLISTNSSTVN